MQCCKKARRSLTVWFALSVTPVTWFMIWWNNGMIPVTLQWIGPPIMTICVILLRLRTDEPIYHYKCKREITHQDGKDVTQWKSDSINAN